MPKPEDGFEFIEASQVEFVKRGRKATVDNGLVEALKTLKVGGAVAIRKMAQDPQSPDYAREKARVSSQIRKACELAGIAGFSVLWSPTGIPQVKRNK
jgi:hypothetical protein